MAEQKAKRPARKTSGQSNEGEGNRTAARNYNAAQQVFVRSGKVEKKAREAAKAIEGPEREELERAEAEGKRHIAEEDPEVER
jgi:hypothetical protein